MKKILSFIFALAALTAAVAAPACAWNADDPIASIDDLRSFRDAVNAGESFAGKTVLLAADIDLGGERWIPIGTDETPFAGKFNGGNHKIENMTVTTDEMRGLTVAGVKGKGGGLFLNVEGEGAQIANLTVTGAVDCAPADGMAAAGGVAARLGPGAVIYRCLNKTTVTLGGGNGEYDTYSYAGGLAGHSEGNLIYCVNEGAVTSEALHSDVIAGGLAGAQLGGVILFSDNDAEVAIPHIADGGYRMAYAGGIAGTMRSASVSCVRNQRSVSCDMSYVYAGGITAHAMDTVLRDAVNAADVRCSVQRDLTAMAGGIAAQLYSGSSAVNCYNTGGVTVTGSASYAYAGGIAGWSGALRSSNKIYNCTNSGAISAEAISSARVGGLAGELNKTELYASVSTGAVSAGRFVAGGVAGYKYPEADIHDVAYVGDFPPVAFGDRNSADAQSLTEEEISGFVVTAFPSLSPVIAAVRQGDEKTVEVKLHAHPGRPADESEYYALSEVYVEPANHAEASIDGGALRVTGTEPGVSLLAAYVDTYRSGDGGTVDKSGPSRSLVTALVWVTAAESGEEPPSDPETPDGKDDEGISIPSGPIEIPGSGGGESVTPPLWPDGVLPPEVPGEPDTDKDWSDRYPHRSCGGGGGCNYGWGTLALLAFAPLMLRRKK